MVVEREALKTQFSEQKPFVLISINGVVKKQPVLVLKGEKREAVDLAESVGGVLL